MMINNRMKGNVLLLLTAIIWGTSFIATKSGAEALGPFAFNAIRTLIGGIALIPVISLLSHRNKTESTRVQDRKSLLVGGILCGIALFFAGAFQQIGILTKNQSIREFHFKSPSIMNVSYEIIYRRWRKSKWTHVFQAKQDY